MHPHATKARKSKSGKPLCSRLDGLTVKVHRSIGLRFTVEGRPSESTVALPLDRYRDLPPERRWFGQQIYELSLLVSGDTKDQGFVLRTVVRFVYDWLQTLVLYGFPQPEPRELDLKLGVTQEQSASAWIKTLKAAILWPTQALDAVQAPKVLPFKGAFRKYFSTLFQRKRSRRSRKVNSLAQTILFLKKIADVVPESFIDETVDKYLDMVEGAPRQPRWFKKLIIKTGQGYARGVAKRWNWDKPLTEFSAKSCVESNSQQGGQKGFALRTFGTVPYVGYSRGGVVTGKRLCPIFREEVVTRQTVYKRNVVAITEPLKVRTITLSHWWESAFWADFQKAAASYISEIRESWSGVEIDLNLVRSYISECNLLKAQKPEWDWVYVSDDADAATDGLDPRLSAAFWMEVLPSNLKGLFADTFGATSRCEFSYIGSGWERTVQQSTCQPMGDRRSFVTLQLLHISAKRAFGRRASDYMRGHGVVTTKLPFRTNGDDGVIFMPRQLVEHYFDFMSHLWSINRQKTRINSNYFSINSETYHVPTGTKLGQIRWNLVRGQTKYGGQSVNPGLLQTVLRDLPDGVNVKGVFNRFLFYWKKRLNKTGRDNNLFLPRSVGGYGVRPHPEISYEVTGFQWAYVNAVRRSVGTIARPPPATRVMTGDRPERGRLTRIGVWATTTLGSTPLPTDRTPTWTNADTTSVKCPDVRTYGWQVPIDNFDPWTLEGVAYSRVSLVGPSIDGLNVGNVHIQLY